MPTNQQDLPMSVVLARAARALAVWCADMDNPTLKAELAQWRTPLAAWADRMAAGSERKRRSAKGGAGRPPVAFVVEHEQGGTTVAWGLAAAAAHVNKSPQTVQNGISKYGRYEFRDTSGDGEWVVSVRRATEAETAQIEQEQVTEELGTVDAS